MSQHQNPPAGWTWSQFKAVCADVGSWTWGTVQGVFNEKASITQIIVDAVIGMIPLVGDATAVRDLIAVIIGLSSDEEKRNSKWEWILLVVLLFALIPVFGGIVKGTGRIVVKVAKEAAVLAGAARMAHLRAGAMEVIEFLNRIGVKNAEKWLLSLRIADHTSELIGKFTHLMATLDNVLSKVRPRISSFPSLTDRLDSLRTGLAKVRDKGKEMIPAAIKEFDQQLREIQAFIRSGGETTSRVALHEVATGQRATTRVDERRLIEDGVLPVRNTRGGFSQNPAKKADAAKINKLYQHEAGYPDLMTLDANGEYNKIAAYAGKMVNRQLKDGEQVFRFFGPARVTHGVPVGEAAAGGGWWGIGPAPKTAKEWRELAAVLDSFNGDGFFVSAKVVGSKGPKAVVGTVSEQFGKILPGQYLPGGATQAFFYLDRAFSDALTKAGQAFTRGENVGKIIDTATGLEFTFHRTGWKDANGIWGYVRGPSATTTQTARVGTREQASKENKEVIIHP
ncbi:hypothetical protein SAMN05216319_1527 [Duganella sp. CF402]|uniref:hypothetical protein n=1 Tax=unclassified Duganella TaxID=2636909 RepID=UPI0008CE1EAB|nr:MULTISPECIES: hypothetical protein [unclassified Duganella]RZT10024.1 hypothetical protein EV582_2099 [Duganella sp. BK701]SEL32146.1 hypothetical protein SAMN05216319_1527 [Duganella sp. CF402]